VVEVVAGMNFQVVEAAVVDMDSNLKAVEEEEHDDADDVDNLNLEGMKWKNLHHHHRNHNHPNYYSPVVAAGVVVVR
jgi:hypothetical protein